MITHSSARPYDPPGATATQRSGPELLRTIRATHEPYLAGPGYGILPDEIRVAIPIQVVYRSNAPVSDGSQHFRRTGDHITARAAQVPYLEVAVDGILPNQVRPPIAVKIPRPGDAPGVSCCQFGPAQQGDPQGSTEIFDPGMTRRRILPDQIWVAIAIEVRGRYNAPAIYAGNRRGLDRTDPIRTAQEPYLSLAGCGILPHQIGMAVAVEIGHGREAPGVWFRKRQKPDTRSPLNAAHQPDLDVPAAGVPRNEIRASVAIKIG